MRLVIISDTHGFHSCLGDLFGNTLPEGDVLIHSGDMSNVGKLNEVMEFAEFSKRWKYKKKIIVAGNHDFLFEKDPSIAEEILKNAGWIYLRDVEYVYEGVKFYGSPWTPEFFNWAFMLTRHSPKMRSAWDLIPKDTDVLITHGPAYGTHDFVHYDKIHVGCELLAERLEKIKPKVHCFGHIHETYGYSEKNGILSINSSICDLQYTPRNKPIVVDYINKVAKIVVL